VTDARRTKSARKRLVAKRVIFPRRTIASDNEVDKSADCGIPLEDGIPVTWHEGCGIGGLGRSGLLIGCPKTTVQYESRRSLTIVSAGVDI
jgi:hypothetical protein